MSGLDNRRQSRLLKNRARGGRVRRLLPRIFRLMKVFLSFALSLSTSALRAARAVHGQSPLPVKAKPSFLFLFFFFCHRRRCDSGQEGWDNREKCRRIKEPTKNKTSLAVHPCWGSLCKRGGRREASIKEGSASVGCWRFSVVSQGRAMKVLVRPRDLEQLRSFFIFLSP